MKHVMLHTGERPFKCAEPRCAKSFRAHSDLNVHLRNVHKKQPKKLDYPIGEGRARHRGGGGGNETGRGGAVGTRTAAT